MSVNRRKGKYKSAKEFSKEQTDDGFVSKTQLKSQAQILKKFGIELVKLKVSVLESLPIEEVTLKSLMDYQKMTTNLARKRHLMFIGKCLRSEDELEIRAFLDNKEREGISAMQKSANEPSQESSVSNSELTQTNKVEQFIEVLLKANGDKIELFLEKNSQLERQSLRQMIRNNHSAKTDQKKQLAKVKLLDYLKLNGVTDFNLSN